MCFDSLNVLYAMIAIEHQLLVFYFQRRGDLSMVLSVQLIADAPAVHRKAYVNYRGYNSTNIYKRVVVAISLFHQQKKLSFYMDNLD